MALSVVPVLPWPWELQALPWPLAQAQKTEFLPWPAAQQPVAFAMELALALLALLALLSPAARVQVLLLLRHRQVLLALAPAASMDKLVRHLPAWQLASRLQLLAGQLLEVLPLVAALPASWLPLVAALLLTLAFVQLGLPRQVAMFAAAELLLAVLAVVVLLDLLRLLANLEMLAVVVLLDLLQVLANLAMLAAVVLAAPTVLVVAVAASASPAPAAFASPALAASASPELAAFALLALAASAAPVAAALLLAASSLPAFGQRLAAVVPAAAEHAWDSAGHLAAAQPAPAASEQLKPYTAASAELARLLPGIAGQLQRWLQELAAQQVGLAAARIVAWVATEKQFAGQATLPFPEQTS